MTYKVLVTCKQMQESLDELLAETPMPDFSFTTPDLTKQGFTSSEMVELMKGHDAAIVGDDVVDEAVLSVDGLKILCKWGAGVDGIDFEAAEMLGITVANTPGSFGDDVADLAFAYLVSLARHLHLIDRRVREGGWPRIRGTSLRDMRVLVYGYGDIGKSVAERLVASKCKVTAVEIDKSRWDEEKSPGITFTDSLVEAASGVDAMIVACPLNSGTRSSVDEIVMSNMNTGAFLVNVSRGPVVNEADLVRLLTQRKLGGAALDVFENEPLNLTSKLRELETVILGSHNASNSSSGVRQASKTALNILRVQMK